MDGQKKQQLMGAMRVIQLKISLLLIVFFLVGTSVSWAGDYTDSAQGPYTASAHGQKVKRKSLSDYAQGNCGHCHVQHASVDGTTSGPYAFALFANNFNVNYSSIDESINICFRCHNDSGSAQVVYNYSFSKVYGGYTDSSANSILDLFSLASIHNLKDIYYFMRGENGNSSSFLVSFFTAYSNPCVACHNPHLAKSDYTVSKPSEHEVLFQGLLSNLSNYVAPYCYSPTSSERSTQEPCNSVRTMPALNYINFCVDCHNKNNSIKSTVLGDVISIDWSSFGDKHGQRARDEEVYLKAPYYQNNALQASNFVTSCTDCHEPHGSPNPYLLRTEVNSKEVSISVYDATASTIAQKYGPNIGYLCRACHKDDADFGRSGGVNRWEEVHHLAPDAPYPKHQCKLCHSTGMGTGGMGKPPIPCLNCHKHGSKDDWAPSEFRTGRICF